MPALLVLLITVPVAAVAVAAIAPRQVTEIATVASGLVVLILAVALLPGPAAGVVQAGHYLRADALSEVFLLGVAFVYAATAVFAVGYQAHEARQSRTDPAAARAFARYSRRFYIGLNAFAASMVAAPLVNGLALLWIAVEITTVVSALLVALDDTESAAEAAWKYVLIASSGLGIALLATIVMYYAGAQVLGQSYDLAFDPLLSAASGLPATAVHLAFVLAVVGFGTKVGLFPVHTWLPDAHAEAPTPVSAMLSGSLLAVSFYAILRYYQVTAASVGPAFPQRVLLVFGALSLLLAAFSLLRQRDIKRLLAYSSVEHMGILAIGIGVGAPIAFAGVLLHVLAHAAAKGNAFMGAGVLTRAFGTKQLSGMRDAIGALPWSGPLFLISVFALTAMPPFGIFRSEFQIVSGAVEGEHGVTAGVLVALVTLAFVGLTASSTRVLFHPAAPASGTAVATEPHPLMVLPVLAGVLVLLVLGLHPPQALADLIAHGVAELQGVL